MDNRRYKFFHDPAHGWLEVPVQELQELGIAEEISGYSYISRSRGMAYLEEDCDLMRYLNALGYTAGDSRGFFDRAVEDVYLESPHCGTVPHYIRNCEHYS